MEKTIRISRLLIVAFCASSLLSSCVREVNPAVEGTLPGELVDVSFNLTMEPLAEKTEKDTKGKAINTTDNKEVNVIKNLWILQFDGTDDNARRVGNPVYNEQYNASDVHKLIASSEPNRLVFIANTFTKTIAFGDCRTLADAKAMIRSITDGKESQVVRIEDAGDGTVEQYPMMNGYQDLVVQSGITVNASLKHSVARVDVKVVNAIPGTVTIESLTLKSIPDRFNYITFDLPAIYPQESSLTTLDYDPMLWEDGEADGGDPNRRKFSFYLPANKRGITTDNTQGGKYKGFFAPDKATYALITASYMEGDTKRSVSYTFYLGENLTDDYNIESNGHYSYTFTINNKGDENSDGRVKDSGTIDFCSRELANCYIINPPEAAGSWRNYRIPVKRVYDFWKVDGKYEDNGDYALLSSSEGWVVDVIWSEFPIDDDHFKWVRKNRLRSQGLDPESDYFEFQIKEGVQGNCVVGIRRYVNSSLLADDFYLWSWHLWVTDYEPDKVSLYTVDPSDNRYEYHVPGGNVHKYDNDIFRTGIYAGKVIMDRNLGAMDINYHGGDGSYGYLYYQFGRKDPFTGPRSIYIRNADGTVTQHDWSTSEHTISVEAIGYDNVPYSINNPIIFIKSVPSTGCWTKNDKYNPSKFDGDIRWQDPYVKTDEGKSMFDPCPSGWKVPEKGIWKGFYEAESGQYTKFLWNDPLSVGRNYFPNGKDDRTTGTIFYPANGALNYNQGNLVNVSSCFVLWSSQSNYDLNSGTCYFSTSKEVSPSVRYVRAFGISVRCVQE